jgi:hypothetical protein
MPRAISVGLRAQGHHPSWSSWMSLNVFFVGVWSKNLSFVCIRGCVVGRLVFEMRRLSARHHEAEVRQEAASLALCV